MRTSSPSVDGFGCQETKQKAALLLAKAQQLLGGED